MSEHTRGPWALVHRVACYEDGHYPVHFAYVVGPDGSNVMEFDTSSVCSATKLDDGTWRESGTEEFPYTPNAHLIVAAPELLLACKGLMNILSTPTEDEDAERQALALIVYARAALAKAEGRS